ncbi:MAG: CPBP family intramembrane metalloprotease [Methanospirillaceae archaeon]|nr:CPBP family intramembrane metalloprotease [Methanospirillaceae archaeon]
MNKEILVFIGITFLITYAFDLLLILTYGTIDKVPPFSTIVQMTMPAIVAIFCMCVYTYRTLTCSVKITYLLFLLSVAVFLFEMYLGPVIPVKLVTLPIFQFMPTLSLIVIVASICIIMLMNVVKRLRDELYPFGLSIGKNLKWYGISILLFSLLFFSVYYLNHLFHCGDPYFSFNLKEFFTSLCINCVLGFFVGWVCYFGEEYGWRIYLQDRLFTKFGGRIGVLILGIIWGLWHSGLIIMGMNYPDKPFIGNLVMLLLSVVFAVFFCIVVLKTGSVWIAVILHMITDTTEPLAWFYISYPTDMIYSFGTGIFGIIIMGFFAIILLRHDIWDNAAALIAERQGRTGP